MARGAPPALLATAMDSLASPVCWDSLVVQSEGRWPHPIPWHHPPWWLRERRQRMEFQASRPEAKTDRSDHSDGSFGRNFCAASLVQPRNFNGFSHDPRPASICIVSQLSAK